MSSMSSVAGLSKYITSLPRIRNTIIVMIIISFITGSVNFLLNSVYDYSIIEKILFGGLFGFIVLGVSSIISGGINQQGVNTLNGINFKIKHSMFLSLLSMSILSIILTLGGVIGRISGLILLQNSLIFGCILIFGFNTLIFWSVAKIGFSKSAIIGTFQPILILAIYVLFSFFTNTMGFADTGITIILKIIVGCIILIAAIYSFIRVAESPMKKNLGIGMLDLLSLFIANMNDGSNSLEKLFENIGEKITTLVTFASFKGKNGIKALFICPCVHPGPLGSIGGSNMPTILANKFDNFTMVVHGPSTHDFNPVAVKEINKIENAVRKGLENVEYSNTASKFMRYNNKKANIGVQFLNKGMIILTTFAPNGSDDIEFSIGLTMMTKSKSKCCVEDSIIVDCHNSFTEESGGVLPGNEEVFELIDVVDKIQCEEKQFNIKVGCYENNMNELDKNEGVGESGIKTMVIEVDNQRTAYVLFDSNNMEINFRQEIIDSVKNLDIDEIEVMTTDTHSVNTIARGYNPIGIEKKSEIIEYVKKSIKEAINDLEEVEVATSTEKIENIKTFGPNNSIELISTISSIVAVTKIIAPVLFLTALLIVFVWIFYMGTF